MTSSSKPPAPKGLASRGARFWRATVAEYELTPGELNLLAEACRTLDTLDALAEVLAADGPTTTGAAGQVVVHPCVSEARQQRLTLHRLLAALSLPDDEGATVPSGHQLRAVTANRARWSRTDTEAAACRAGA